MDTLQLAEQYVIGHPTLDQHHLRLFEHLQELDEAIDEQSEKAARLVMDGMLEYSLLHHDEEELLLRQAGYPQKRLHQHQISHRKFTNHVRQFQSRLKSGHDALELAPQLHDYVQFWLHHHILMEDHEFKNWLQQPGSRSIFHRLLARWLH